MPRTRLTAGLVLVVCVALTGAALAGTQPDPNTGDTNLGTKAGLRYASESAAFNLSNSGFATADAGCGPASNHLLGGGVGLTGPLAKRRSVAGLQPLDYTDADTIPDDGWSAGGYGLTAGHLTTFAICGQDTSTYYDQVIAPTGSQVRSGQASCGPGAGRAVSGGGLIATSGSYISQSFPSDGPDADNVPDDGWHVRVFDTIGSGIGGFHVHLVCHVGPASYPKGSASVSPHKAAAVTATCPNGTHVVGGGGKMTGPGDHVWLANDYPVDLGDADSVPDDGWKVAAFNGSTQNQTLTSYAVCI